MLPWSWCSGANTLGSNEQNPAPAQAWSAGAMPPSKRSGRAFSTSASSSSRSFRSSFEWARFSFFFFGGDGSGSGGFSTRRFFGFVLQSWQSHSPRGSRVKPTHAKWNQLSQPPSHATISP